MYEIEEKEIAGKKAAVIVASGIVVKNAEDGLDLLGNCYYQGFDLVVLKQEHLPEAFFDLKTRMAGEILQKFSNYRMQLMIVGNFEQVESKSLTDFIRESNRGGAVQFVNELNV